MSKHRILSVGKAPSEAIHLAVDRASPASKVSVSSLDAHKAAKDSHLEIFSMNLRRCLEVMVGVANNSSSLKGKTSCSTWK